MHNMQEAQSKQETQELKIEEYTLHDFLDKFQKAVQDGYVLDLESNERFPQKFGSQLYVIMIKQESIIESSVKIEDDGHRGSESNPIDLADSLADLEGVTRPSDLESASGVVPTEKTPKTRTKKTS